MRKIIFSFATIFKPIGQSSEFLAKPIANRYQAKQVVKQYNNQLTNEQISNLLQSLHYFIPNEIIAILKKSLVLKQVFGKDEFTQYFLNRELDSIHKANLILLCYKFNLHDDVWTKCLTMIVEDLSPYYLSETMWALKNKQFQSQEIQETARNLQLKIVEQIPKKLDQFDFYCLSLMLQSLETEYQINYNALAERFFMIVDEKDHFPLCYGLYALTKMKSKLSPNIKKFQIIETIEKCMPYLKQSDLLLALWAFQKLEYGNEQFWRNAYKFLQSHKIQSLQSIAIQSQIISQVFNFDDEEWTKIEKKVIQFIKSDEKSLVTLFQTFSINKKGSLDFWNILTNKILEDVNDYKLESIFKLATHSEILEFSSQLPLNWTKLSISQQCLIINKFTKLGLNVEDKFKLIKKNISQLIGKDLSLILYTINKYYPTMPLDDYFDQLTKSVHQLNQMDVEQLLQLQFLPEDIKDLVHRQQQKLLQNN